MGLERTNASPAKCGAAFAASPRRRPAPHRGDHFQRRHVLANRRGPARPGGSCRALLARSSEVPNTDDRLCRIAAVPGHETELRRYSAKLAEALEANRIGADFACGCRAIDGLGIRLCEEKVGNHS
ncbi:MAG: hypothetical protein R3322_02150 [Kiloniellales bacterium]|nr:hypothetical protein [Kiloniellales bacterium]